LIVGNLFLLEDSVVFFRFDEPFGNVVLRLVVVEDLLLGVVVVFRLVVFDLVVVLRLVGGGAGGGVGTFL